MEGKTDQHVIKHKNNGLILIPEPRGKSVNMQKFRDKIVIFPKFELRTVLNSTLIK